MCLARIQIRVVLFVVIMNRLLLLLLLLFQFIDSIGYRLPIMIVGQPKSMLQNSATVGKIEIEKKRKLDLVLDSNFV